MYMFKYRYLSAWLYEYVCTTHIHILTPDNKAGRGGNVVNSGLCSAGVASSMLQLGVLNQ